MILKIIFSIFQPLSNLLGLLPSYLLVFAGHLDLTSILSLLLIQALVLLSPVLTDAAIWSSVLFHVSITEFHPQHVFHHSEYPSPLSDMISSFWSMVK